MKFKKLLTFSLVGTIVAASVSAVAVACSKTESKNDDYKIEINKNDSLFLATDLSTKEGLKISLISSSGQKSFAQAVIKQTIYEWAKNNKNPKISNEIAVYDQDLDSQLERIENNISRSYPNSKDLVIQNELLDNDGGSVEMWKKTKSIENAYKLFSDAIFDDTEDYLSIYDENNNLVPAYSLESEKLLKDINTYQPSEIGTLSKIVVDTKEETKKGIVNLFKFIIDDFIKFNLPISTSNFNFKYDSLSNQNVYNKKLFEKMASESSLSFPWFDAKPIDNTKTNTTTNYQEVVKFIKENDFLDQKYLNNKIDKKYSSNSEINKSINLSEVLHQKEGQLLYSTALIALFLSVTNKNIVNKNFNVIENFDDNSILNNFLIKSESELTQDQKDKNIELFYPLTKGNEKAFLGDFNNLKAVNSIILDQNGFALVRDEKGVDLIGINNYNRLKQAASKGFESLMNEIRNDFLFNGALNLSTRKSSSISVKGYDIKPKLKSYFNQHKERILANYIATQNAAENFLFKHDLKDQTKLDFLNQETVELLKGSQLNYQSNYYNELDANFNNKLLEFNKKTQINLNPKDFYNNGINTPLKLSKDANKNIELIKEFNSLFTTQNAFQDYKNKLSQNVDNYLKNINIESILVKNKTSSQSINFNDYILNYVLKNTIQSNIISEYIKQQIVLKEFTNLIDPKNLNFLNNDLLNKAINQNVKLNTIYNSSNVDKFSDFTNFEKVYKEALTKWNQNNENNTIDANYKLNYNSLSLLQNLLVIKHLMSFDENNNPTYKNLINYLNNFTNNNNVGFVAWKSLNNTSVIKTFGKGVEDDFGFKKYQLNQRENFDLYSLNKNDVYTLNDQNEIQLKEDFLNNLTYNSESNYWNIVNAVNNKQYIGFIGLIDKNNQSQKLGKEFEKINLFDLVVFANNPTTQFKGALYGYDSKNNLKQIVDKFESYNDFKQLAQKLYSLNFKADANKKFKTIIDNKKEVIESQSNEVKDLELSISDLKTIMHEGIDLINDEAFIRLQTDYVYHKLNNNSSATVKKDGSNDLEYSLIVSQFNQKDIDNLVVNNQLNDSNTGYLGLGKEMFFNLLVNIAVNDTTLKTDVLTQLGANSQVKIFDKRLDNNSLNGWVKLNK